MNMRCFGWALLLKSLWRGIFGEGTRGKIIRYKYQKDQDFRIWYRIRTISISTGSSIWNSFRKVENFFLQNLAWTMELGNNIIMGSDHILGYGVDHHIPEAFIHFLNGSGIFFFSQAIDSWRGPCPSWKEVNELGLVRPMAMKWERTCTHMNFIGIYREDISDWIVWSGKMKGGNIMVADAYKNLRGRESQQLELSEFYKFWKKNTPMKIILFFWLVCRNKNLTWENSSEEELTWAKHLCDLQECGGELCSFVSQMPLHGPGMVKLAHTIGFPCISFDNV